MTHANATLQAIESLAAILKRMRLASPTAFPDVAESANDCPNCGGYGWVVPDLPVDHPAFGRAIPCTCKAAQHEERKVERLQRYCNIPLPMLDAMTFAAWNTAGNAATEEQRRTLAYAYNAARRYAEHPEGHWLVLLGGVGSGKTHLAVAVAASRPLRDVFFASVPDFLDHLRRTYAPSSEVAHDNLFDRAKQAPLLILDDLGAESPTPWAREKLLQLVVHRHNARFPTVVTSPSLADMPTAMASRLRDRRVVTVVRLAVPDYRGARA